MVWAMGLGELTKAHLYHKCMKGQDYSSVHYFPFFNTFKRKISCNKSSMVFVDVLRLGEDVQQFRAAPFNTNEVLSLNTFCFYSPPKI
jgi:hypothetical protein